MALRSNTAPDIGMRPARPATSELSRHCTPALVSLAMHAGFIVLLLLAAPPLPAIIGEPARVPLLFEPPAATARHELAAAALERPAVAAPAPLPPTLPKLDVVAHEPPVRPAAAKPAAPTTTLSEPVAARPAPAPAVRPVPSEADVAGLKMRIREAVRAATVYPAVARQMHREGRAQVRFDYIDGNAQAISLATSSHSGLLDEAALTAVQRAPYPRPLTGLEGVRLSLLVWVDFSLRAAD